MGKFFFHTAITQSPQSINATFGETATFYCSGHGHNVTWMIDGTDVKLMSPEMIKLRGIEVATTKFMIYIDVYFPEIYSIQSSLNIIANCINNYTTVQCSINTCSNFHTANGSLKVEGRKPDY